MIAVVHAFSRDRRLHLRDCRLCGQAIDARASFASSEKGSKLDFCRHSARRQVEPTRTLRARRQELWYPPSNAMGRFNEAADPQWHLLLVLSVLVSCDCTRI